MNTLVRLLILKILVLFFVVSIQAQVNNKYEEGKVYRNQLENGLTILTVERHIAPLIYHQLTYKVGSRNEKLGITGISHVVEHMMFKGTPKYGKGVASKTISNNSGIFNAFTMNDMTSYYEYFPKNKIEIAMDIESDRMQNAEFKPGEFDSEIEVIKQERRMRTESQAGGILSEMMNSVAYSSHPNRDPIIGWPGDLDHMNREEAFAYYKTYYTPNNAFLVLIGDFETDEILKTVEKYYGKIPRGPEVQEMWAVEQDQKVKKTFTLHHTDITTPSVKMAFHIPNYSHEDIPALRLAAMILCEKSRGARLYNRLVEQDRIATMAAGGFGMSKDPALFSISVSIHPDSSMEKVEKKVWEEIGRMQNESVTDNELQKVKNRYKFNQATNYTKNTDIGGRISRYEAYYGWDFFDQFDSRVKDVTKEDILRVMEKYFAEEKATIAYSYPKEGAVQKPKKMKSADEGEEETDEIGVESDKFYFQPPLEALQLSTGIFMDTDEVIKPLKIEPLINSQKLDNGITLYTIENHLVPSVSVIGSIETGIMPEAIEGGQPGIATLLGEVMNRGTEKINYDQLVERMSFVPFSFSVSGNYKNFFFQGNSLIEDADEMLSTGFDIVTNPALNNDEMEKVLPKHVLSAKNRLKKTSVKAFYHMFNTLFEGHILTKYNSTPESLNSITRDDLVDLHEKYFNPEQVTLFMIGDMTPDQMRELANKYFGKWESSSGKLEVANTNDVKEYDRKEIKVFPEKEYTECTINIGFKPFNKIDPDEEEIVSALNYILSGSALTSRMGIELRDKQGLIYGIKSELWVKSDKIGYWKFNTKTGPQNTEKVISGIFLEIRKLLKDGITDEELSNAKQRQLGLLPFYVETPDDAAQIVFSMISEKRPFDSFDKKAERILSITKDDVLRIAEKYFTLNNFMIVVDGPIEENSLDHLLNEL